MWTMLKRHGTLLWGVVVFCLVFGTLTLWNLSSLWHAAPMSTLQVRIRSATRLDPQALRSSLSAALFGVYVPVSLSSADVKPSLLNMAVVGVLFSEDPSTSQVILRLSDGQERGFHVGDALPFGAVIQRILPTGVLIEREGVLEQLSLPKKEGEK